MGAQDPGWALGVPGAGVLPAARGRARPLLAIWPGRRHLASPGAGSGSAVTPSRLCAVAERWRRPWREKEPVRRQRRAPPRSLPGPKPARRPPQLPAPRVPSLLGPARDYLGSPRLLAGGPSAASGLPWSLLSPGDWSFSLLSRQVGPDTSRVVPPVPPRPQLPPFFPSYLVPATCQVCIYPWLPGLVSRCMQAPFIPLVCTYACVPSWLPPSLPGPLLSLSVQQAGLP